MARAQKNPAAVELGRKRWNGTTKAERAEQMAAVASARWGDASAGERHAQGKRLAAARKAKRGKK